MKLKLKNTPEQVELIAALGSRDQTVSREAQEAFAAFVGPVLQQVIKQASTAGLIYSDMVYDEDDSPSIPLDLWYDDAAGYIQVWSQHMAGGLPTSVVEGVKEIKIATYRLDTGVTWKKQYARKHRLDVVSKALERMAQEVLVKQERNAWAVILKALGEAQSVSSSLAGTALSAGKNGGHVMASYESNTGAGGTFLPHDVNRMMTFMRRLNESFANGTPDPNNGGWGLTDLFVSPEIMELVRTFAWEPVSAVRGSGASAMGLPESARESVWRSAGMNEIYGITLHELMELGKNQKYNVLFDDFKQAGIAHHSTDDGTQGENFSSANNELLVGLDLSKESFVRPVAQQGDHVFGSGSASTFTVLPDDQYLVRSDKVGFFGFMEEGRVCIDARAIMGLVV